MTARSTEPPSTSYTLPGLTGAAEIIVDRWGVPHIYAATSRDAFRAQGFNAARDRLWQIDFWRRRGLGLLSEVFGAEYVERDRAARLFLYRGDMDSEWPAYGSDAEQVATAFVDGVNGYVALTRDDPSLLPVEFRELGYEPAFWSASDVARIRSHGLCYNLREEVARALTLRDYGADVEELRRRREPQRCLEIPGGLDLSLMPDDVLRVYDLATAPPGFAAPVPGTGLQEGSNNWVLSGDRTATGRPMLANDPHRALSLPSLRYLAQLNAPDLDVIGAGEPALPGVSIGHNGHIAFGLTIFPVDQEDLYVYRTNPDNPLEYRYRDHWEPMRVQRETITVRDGSPVEVQLWFTRHGPVIYTDRDRNTAFAVRAAWLQPGMAPYLGSIDYMRARDCSEFLEALNRWGAPPENQVYADTEGTIGWKAAGRTPVRPNWDGTLPVPGDGRYEWQGCYDVDELPGGVDPERSWLATANEMNLPDDFPEERTVTHDWQPPFRRHRIGEVLEAASAVSVRDMVALQNDVVSIPARRVLGRLRSLPEDDVDGLRMLLDWDGRLHPHSAAAALFEVWFRRHLCPAVLSRALEAMVVPERHAGALARIAPADDLHPDARVVLDLLEGRDDRLGPDVDRLVTASLRDAVADVERLLGTDRAEWSWGRLHVAWLRHPLAPLLTSIPDEALTAGPLPRGGSADTVSATAYGPDFVQAAGSSFRIAVDVGSWDDSVAMNSPGQSGRPGDTHFTDLFAAWAGGDAFPLLYSRARVEAAAEHVIELDPP